jgi:aminoglycoside 6'-N-acetyltransferase I
MQLEFVEITAANAPAFAQLFVDAFIGPPWNVPWTRDAASERLLSFSSFPRFRGLGAHGGIGPVGLVLGWGERWRRGWVFHLKEMCVAPAVQKRGIGKALLERFERALAADGYQSVYLETSPDAASRGFYEHCHYRRLDLVSLTKQLAHAS